MKTRENLKTRQGGAVAVMVGFSIVLLVGFLAMVIDLGHLYIAKTELQNGADAAALAGAKELDSTPAGVSRAIAMAQDLAGRNYYDFANKKIYDTTDAETQNDAIDIWVGSCPDNGKCTMMPVSAGTAISKADAADKTFLKVHTRNRDMIAYFAPIWNIFHVSTYGMAVAGYILENISPLGVCALSVGGAPRLCTGPGNECGFLRGVAYNIPEINPFGMSALPLLINPVDVPPAGCDPNNSSANNMRPFLCQGKAAGPRQIPGEIYANTGGSWGPVETTLNSRFDLYLGSGKCDPVTAPPDANVKRYEIGGPPNQGGPRDWMANPDNPTKQSIEVVSRVPQTYNPSTVPRANGTGTASQWGVLWSYARERNFGTGTTGPDYDLSNWATLYSGAQADTTQTPALQMGYPLPGGTPTPPYQYGLTNQSSKYFKVPPNHPPGMQDRRVLNLLIIDCGDPNYPIGPSASCAKISVVGIGRFFMQTVADSGGSPKKLYGEFAGLLPPGALKKQYVLYR